MEGILCPLTCRQAPGIFNMPGSATIVPGVFADDLIGIVDDIRRDIKEGLGFRQFTVDLITVTPVPRLAGGPHNTVSVVDTLDPLPRVMPYKDFKNTLEPCGIDEAGTVKVDQISLTYTEPELTGKNLVTGVEFYWRLTDAHGQETCARYFTIEQAPFPHRECCSGWTIWLRKAASPV